MWRWTIIVFMSSLNFSCASVVLKQLILNAYKYMTGWYLTTASLQFPCSPVLSSLLCGQLEYNLYDPSVNSLLPLG